jgi:hypothetical protein
MGRIDHPLMSLTAPRRLHRSGGGEDGGLSTAWHPGRSDDGQDRGYEECDARQDDQSGSRRWVREQETCCQEQQAERD